jgi:hypothetical protein
LPTPWWKVVRSLNYFFKSFYWVVTQLTKLLGLAAVIAGLVNDVPGLKDDESGHKLITFIAFLFNWALTILREYFDGVVIFLVTATVIHLFITYPHADKMKQQLRNRRKLNVSQRRKNRGKRK